MPGVTPGLAPGPSFGAARPARAEAADQPSMLELLSLRDARRFVPETLGLLLLIVIGRSLLDPGAGATAFWVPVLLMAVQYGIMGGLFAALSASLLLLATALPAAAAAQDFYNHAAAAAVQPCAWFGAALTLGGLRTLHLHNQARTERCLRDATDAATLFGERLGGMAEEMALLERRIATDTAGASVLLDALGRVDLSSARALLASLADFVRHAAGAESFAVFLRQDGRAPPGFLPCFAVEDGVRVPHAALAELTVPFPSEQGDRTGPALAKGVDPGLPVRSSTPSPIVLPIVFPGAGEPLGVLVCTRLAPAFTPVVAASRLKDVCRVLAKLLPSVHDASTGREPARPGPEGA